MNKKSFTLIELLVVVAIIGILSSLVIARFSDWGDNARIANTLQWSAGVHRTLGANLVGHWPFNGDANDISGYGNDGDIYGSVSWGNGITGTDNMSLNFDGSTNYMDTNYGNGLDFSLFPHTISIWLKADDLINPQMFMSPTSWINEDRLYLGLLNGRWRMGIQSSWWGAGQVLATNNWTNITVVMDGSEAKMYVNADFSHSKSYTSYTIPSDFFIGRGGGSYYFNGSLADLCIYDAALTVEEVSRIYAESKDKYLVYE